VGYLAAPREFVRRITEARHTLSINAATPSQWAALAALQGPQEPVEAMVRAYGERRTQTMAALDALGFTYGHPGGAFYVYTNVSHTGLKAGAFCEALLREARVLVFPGTLFGDPGDSHIRISLLQPALRIGEAFERIAVAKQRLFAS
jgi:aminotransferase